VSRLRIAPIVEGDGEYAAIRILLERIWREIVKGEYVEVLRPIRWPRSKLVQSEELGRAIELAARKLRNKPLCGDPETILVLLDADRDAPCLLGSKLLECARQCRPDVDICCVLAKVEYETWFVAAVESLREYLDLPPGETVPASPEEARAGKSWIQRYVKGPKYSETIEQPSMTAQMDLVECRRRSPSFDKLCRELERRARSEPTSGSEHPR
jgi:hypothetical protein